MKFLFSFLPTIFVFLSLQVHSEIIKEIDIKGISNISRGTILAYLPFETGDDIKQSNLPQITERLNETGFFKKVLVDYSNGKLLINIDENPVIKYLDFLNYEEDLVLSEKLIDSIKLNSELGIGDIYSKKNLDQLIKELQTLYQLKGFYNAKISTNTSQDSNNRIGIEIVIEENEPALISSMQISGGNFYSEEDLLDLFDIGTPDFFIVNYFTNKDHFDQRKLEAGLESIKNKYNEAGFVDMQIKSAEVKISDDKTSIDIRLLIEEGSQYTISSINWTGNFNIFSKEFLINNLDVKPGDIFSRKALLKSLREINTFFGDKGYAKPEIKTSLTKIKDETSCILTINIDENKKYYINRIEINGNTRTQDDVVRREVKILEGQAYSKTDIDNSINRIKRLGFFKDVAIKTLVSNENEDQINLIITVEETKTGEFTIGLSHSNASGAAFNTGIRQNNIFGTGNVFNGQLTNSKAVEEVSFFFKNPHYNKEGHSISYGLFSKTTDAASLDVSNYVVDETGLISGYGVPLSSDTDLEASVRLSNISLACGSTFASEGYEPVQCNDKDNIDFNVNFTYSNNSLNDFYNPTKGNKTRITSGLSLPVGDLEYYKFEANTSRYYPIMNDSTILLKGNLLMAQGYNNKELPFYKRYYGGGSSSVRGFDFNSLGSKYPDGKAKGGESSSLLSTSFITPGKRLGIDNDNIRIGAFIDMGSINEKISEFDFNEIRSSTGIALSWLTPVGPIGFYYATPLIQKSGDSTESFSFELGTTF